MIHMVCISDSGMECPEESTDTGMAMRDLILEEGLAKLNPGDFDLAVRRRLDPQSVMSMSTSELNSLVQQLVRVGEELGIREIPISQDEDALKPDAFYKLQRRECVAGTGKWWFSWSIEDLGWYSVPSDDNGVPIELGCMVFLTCQLMTRLVLRPEILPRSSLNFAGKSVLELGTGMGMLGISASVRARNVMLTDGEPSVLQLASVNACLNGGDNVRVEQLKWGRNNAKEFRQLHGCFDSIIASDIIYEAANALTTFECVDELLTINAGGTYILGAVERRIDEACPLTSAIYDAAKSCGFHEVAEPIDLLSMMEDIAPEAYAPVDNMKSRMFEFARIEQR